MASQTDSILRVGGSCGSIGRICNKENNPRTCSSQPFNKPLMCLHKFAQGKKSLKRKVLKLLAQIKGTDKEKEDFTFDESKCIIRELAAELSKVVQISNTSLLTRVNEDGSCQEERQDFILQWAEELKHSSQTQQTPAGKITRHRRSDDLPDQQKPDREQKLREATKALSEWAWRLKDMEQDSVCPSEDVCSVLQDLERQRKRGKLPNMLPVMDFLIWSIIQEQQQGSIVKHWLRNRQKSRSRVTLNRVPDSIWTLILKASVEITLDEKTANPNLLLSADRKRVKMATIIEDVFDPWDGYSPSSHKYDGWWCVLAKEGFTSGRHYWEVRVRGKAEWRIGVVRESAPRNGFANLNTEAGYWNLRLQLGELMALSAPVIKLNQSPPSRLGVFLDIEGGQVSFYDAEERCHIYTFNVNFDNSGRIYPVFGTIETDKELVIL
ncbi:SPRY_PRY_C-I_1 domain-containing protein [Salvelinus namaycush]|uniref:SPRY_PRY_C-I_1 domain-containing protein n=1 Tax=Salvelinus namaycush TaxID=8040 RepID=A0A8U1BRK0_SALNM|nr:SPRY_PRY_C-I_1 domain-containing protein [Salvelinus namaycush]